jgi:hypothetical protein
MRKVLCGSIFLPIAVVALPAALCAAVSDTGRSLCSARRAAAPTAPRQDPASRFHTRGQQAAPPDPVLALQVGHSDSIRCFAFSPDGRGVATGAPDRTAILWELPGGQILARLEGHPAALEQVFYTGAGGSLVTVADTPDPPAVRLWDARSGVLARAVPVVGSAHVMFSPEGRWLLTGAAKDYCFWEVRTLCRAVDRSGDGTGVGCTGAPRIAAAGANVLQRGRHATHREHPGTHPARVGPAGAPRLARTARAGLGDAGLSGSPHGDPVGWAASGAVAVALGVQAFRRSGIPIPLSASPECLNA